MLEAVVNSTAYITHGMLWQRSRGNEWHYVKVNSCSLEIRERIYDKGQAANFLTCIMFIDIIPQCDIVARPASYNMTISDREK